MNDATVNASGATSLHRAALLLATGAAALGAHAAGLPALDRHVADCEDRWVLARSKVADQPALLFAYVDPAMGVTVEADGLVGLDAQGRLARTDRGLDGRARAIIRVTQDFSVACLDDAQVEALGLPNAPANQSAYVDPRPAAEHELSWGSHYNEIGAGDVALGHLRKAAATGAPSASLSFETAYALNLLHRFDEAAALLEKAVADHPDSAALTGEFAFTRTSQADFAGAATLYRRAYALSQGNPRQQVDFAFNLAKLAHRAADDTGAAEWLGKFEAAKKAADEAEAAAKNEVEAKPSKVLGTPQAAGTLAP